MNARLNLLFGLLTLALLLPACTPSGRGGGGDGNTDDDDATGDDDDTVSDDDDTVADDDDTVSDDDDTVADDDDDDDDDDDTVMDDDDSTPGFDFNQIQFSFSVESTAQYDLMATFIFSYIVADQAAGTATLTCNQRVEIEGTADFDFGVLTGCDNCTGVMEFFPGTAVDVSNPAVTTDDCDPQYLVDNNISMGLAMLNPFGSTPGYWPTDTDTRNWGDFITIGTMDENTQQVLGYNGSATGAVDLTAAGNADWALNTYGLDFTHVGLVDGSAGSNTLAAESNIGGVSAPAGVGSDFYFYFVMAKDPATNTHEGTDMIGEYLGFARFVITFGS